MKDQLQVTTKQVSDDVSGYVNMRIAALKLSLVEDLSTLFGTALRMMIFIVLMAMGLMLLSVAGVIAIGNLIGSMLWATLIVAGVYVIAALIIYSMRGKFINLMVPMLSKMFFTPRKEKHEDDDDEQD